MSEDSAGSSLSHSLESYSLSTHLASPPQLPILLVLDAKGYLIYILRVEILSFFDYGTAMDQDPYNFSTQDKLSSSRQAGTHGQLEETRA